MDILNNFKHFFTKSNKSYKCTCTKNIHLDYCDKISELLDLSRKSVLLKEEEARHHYKELLKIDHKYLKIGEENHKQIEKDIPRTYPSSLLFQSKEGQNMLYNVLSAFSNYDKEISKYNCNYLIKISSLIKEYVQGMNFIVGAFLYHCEEYVAFWLLIELIENHELRKNYQEGFPGLKIHGNKLTQLVKKKAKNVYDLFEKNDIILEVFIVEWAFSLFGSIMPIEIQIDFYQGFFADGWNYFYKVCITILSLNEKLKSNEIECGSEDIYMALKLEKTGDGVDYNKQLKFWEDILYKAYLIDFE